MPVRQEGLPLCVLNNAHVNHILKQEQPHRSLALISMNEISLKTVFPVRRIEEFPHSPVPIQNPEYSRQMVAFHEFLYSRFQHPKVSMVINHYYLSKAIIPKPQHGIYKCLNNNFMRHDYGSRHTQVMIGMPSVIKRR